MTPLQELLMFKALAFKQGNSALLDPAIESVDAASITRNVCAKVSIQLADRLDNTLNILDLSKRRFVEAAIIAALNEADAIIEGIGMYDNLPNPDDDQPELEGL